MHKSSAKKNFQSKLLRSSDKWIWFPKLIVFILEQIVTFPAHS